MTSQLRYAVYVAEGIPTTVTDLPPDLDKRMWSPTSATLITGERDAVLVDPLFTSAQVEALREWIAASGKNLTAVVWEEAQVPPAVPEPKPLRNGLLTLVGVWTLYAGLTLAMLVFVRR